MATMARMAYSTALLAIELLHRQTSYVLPDPDDSDDSTLSQREPTAPIFHWDGKDT
jgi:hypothetical protein